MAYKLDNETAVLADDMIGAAQVLEREARRLKATAKFIRASGLTIWDGEDTVANQRMHKAADIKMAADEALRAFGAI